ncbi:aminoglycoside phosphotransferase/kinase family protein [Paenibacillus allorhizosphaerae]|uniref:hypothetical protein n=1 Tax=Paenibacillus allorhizosphaerae TaxID=2849866 RepID=UPI001C4032C8|nr:hypothetical protein [Paenibacillus allorhizosphaerae]
MSKPIRSVNGTFVSEGWICTRFEQGHEAKGRVEEKLRVSRSFHRDLSHISAKDFPLADHPWSKSHRIAWQEDGLPHDMPKEAHDVLTGLLRKVNRDGHYKMQLIHGDLAGNILFDETLPPLIIDFSPTIAPVEYAEAILVCDCIAWQGSTLSELRLLPGDEFYKEMIIRAIIFRLSVSAILSKGNITPFFQDYNAFKPIIDDYI